MRPLGLRARALLAALLPVTLVAVALTTVFLYGRVRDLDAEHRQRALAHARQIAAAAEFPMFARNDAALQALVNNALREPDVQAVGILAPDGARVVGAGAPASAASALPQRPDRALEQVQGALRLVVQPIAASDLQAGGGLDIDPGRIAHAPPRLLGYVALELSREEVVRRGAALVLAGTLVTLVGLALGGLLALRLVYTVTGELSAKKDEAERATAAKSRFLAAASHDLRQPLHALGLFVERLAQLRHDEVARRLITAVEASVRALQDLLDALLDISRLDAGAVKPRFAPLAVASLWDALQREFAPAAAKAGLELRLRPSALWVTSDSLLLHRVLLNLVSNALRYTERGGVLVACRRRGRRALIEVWDTGIGIPPAMQSEVFKEFVQLGAARGERGLGLGLTIVERTAKLLGHPLSLRSVPGRGTRFRLDLELAAPGRMEAPGAAKAGEAASFAGLRVLLVDDDALAREATARLLHSWGSAVDAAADSQEAMALLEKARPDLIACDYRLPAEENGLALIRRARARLGAEVPAFLISGDTGPALLQEAAEAGLALLYKPVRPARLFAVVQRLARAR